MTKGPTSAFSSFLAAMGFLGEKQLLSPRSDGNPGLPCPVLKLSLTREVKQLTRSTDSSPC